LNSCNIQNKILIIGAAVFVGQNLIAQLRENGFKNLLFINKYRDNLRTLKSLNKDLTCFNFDSLGRGSFSRISLSCTG
tara:strand:- start:522 stop:755 length:234 start_codon:yes stop_codon:yes gene_type:complete